MNVVIFGKGFGKPRQINLSGVSVWAAAVICAGFVIGIRFCRRLLGFNDDGFGCEHDRGCAAER